MTKVWNKTGAAIAAPRSDNKGHAWKDTSGGTSCGTSPRTQSPRTPITDDWFAYRQLTPTGVLARDHG